MEKLRIFLLSVLTLLLAVSPALASVQVNDIKVILNGSQLKFDVPPSLKNGVTLVPLRAIAENLESIVSWDKDTQSIFISSGTTAIAMRIGDKIVSVNGENKALLRAPEIIQGRTFVPLRFVSEALGVNVAWDNKKRVITIVSNPPQIDSFGRPVDTISVPPGF